MHNPGILHAEGVCGGVAGDLEDDCDGAVNVVADVGLTLPRHNRIGDRTLDRVAVRNVEPRTHDL